MSLKTIAESKEREWRDYDFPDSYLADFALAELVRANVEEYTLRDILSKTAIEALLAFSCKSIEAFHTGRPLSSLGSGGIITRPLDEGMKLELLLKSWSERGWISIVESCGSGTSFVAKLEE